MAALMVSISGMRGTIGGTLTPEEASRYPAALAWYLTHNHKPKNGKHFRVVIGRDSRPSGAWVSQVAGGALSACGIEVVDLDIVSTPGVAMMVKLLNADAGMIITASHNPIQWNGIKFVSSEGYAFPPAVAGAIIAAYREGKRDWVSVDQLHAPGKDSRTHALHTAKVIERVDSKGIAARRYKVVLDSVNGAGCVSGAMLLSKLGCRLVHVGDRPDGLFPHEPEPTATNLTGLCDEVKRQKADIGFAQDPDADRLAIVDENGKYIGEEYTLVLAAMRMLAIRKGPTAANLSSSRMLDDVAAKFGCKVFRTPVGEANVVKAMLDNKCPIGGEGNGGVIDPEIVPGRDSLVGMAYILDLMARTGKTLSELVAETPAYFILKTKFECPADKAAVAVEALKAAFSKERVDTQDGIRVDFAEGWVHARASNTEPIMRIIAEAADEAGAKDLVSRAQKVVDAAIRH